MFRPAALAARCAALLVVLTCCAPNTASQAVQGVSQEQRAAPKRVTAAVLFDLKGLGLAINNQTPPGGPEVQQLVNSGLTMTDNLGTRHPLLGDTVPTIENGLWKVLPDGRMETTWRIRPDARWHDGAPLTADDLVFTVDVEQDPELPLAKRALYNSVESLTVPDARTVVVRWKQTYLWADTLFATGNPDVIPKHVLEPEYRENRANFLALPYWTSDYIGTGPFKMREWMVGSHAVMTANDRFALGRPRIDEIQVVFIQDQSTIITNLLAGAVDMTMSRGISIEQGIQLRQNWREGRIETAPANPLVIFPQFIDPLTPAMLELPFRRALLHAMNREEMVDVLQSGLTTVADAPFLRPGQPEYQAVERSIARYPHDPRRAGDLIESLGYRRGADGFYVDSREERLRVELSTSPSNDIQVKSMLALADYWQRAGVETTPVTLPLTSVRTPQFLAAHPSFWMVRYPLNVTTVDHYLHSSQVGLPENGYRGNNSSRYRNADLDGLIEQYLVTIPFPERMSLLSQIIQHATSQVAIMGLFYDVEVSAIGSRVRNVTGRTTGATESWNAWEWTVS